MIYRCLFLNFSSSRSCSTRLADSLSHRPRSVSRILIASRSSQVISAQSMRKCLASNSSSSARSSNRPAAVTARARSSATTGHDSQRSSATVEDPHDSQSPAYADSLSSGGPVSPHSHPAPHSAHLTDEASGQPRCCLSPPLHISSRRRSRCTRSRNGSGCGHSSGAISLGPGPDRAAPAPKGPTGLRCAYGAAEPIEKTPRCP